MVKLKDLVWGEVDLVDELVLDTDSKDFGGFTEADDDNYDINALDKFCKNCFN